MAGAVNTNCPVCKNNLSECSGKEAVAEPEPEPEQPKKKSGSGLLAVVALLVLACYLIMNRVFKEEALEY